MHIVDTLIAERAPRLASGPFWPVLRPLLYSILDYDKARRMADEIGPMPGQQALDHVSRLLSVTVTGHGLERVPAQGRVILIANHPTGIADGIAVYDALKTIRPDICFYANSDAHRVAPGFGDVLIPVEWVEAKRTRDRTRHTLQETRDAMEAERALMIFPAGRLARKGRNGQLEDPVWMSSAVSMARKYQAPIIPMHLTGPSSTLFHSFDKFSQELRDITLFHELLNKQGKAFELKIGAPIDPARLDADAVQATEALKTYIETVLPTQAERPFA